MKSARRGEWVDRRHRLERGLTGRDDVERGPAKELVFSDSEDDVDDDNEEMPPVLHNFDLDDAPDASGDSDEEMGDEFDLEDDDMDEDEEDSAFASENEGAEDAEFASEDEDMELPPHMRPNPIPGSDDEDAEGLITNIEDDLENDGFTLPVVDGGGEEEEHEHGTSLREVEGRMRWLVRVCAGKDEKVKGIPDR